MKLSRIEHEPGKDPAGRPLAMENPPAITINIFPTADGSKEVVLRLTEGATSSTCRPIFCRRGFLRKRRELWRTCFCAKQTQRIGELLSGAVISACNTYRYRLWRGARGRTLLFIMLNPSTATALTDDPTIRKCLGFAQRLGYGCIEVGNLFGLRAPSPETLLTVADPVGPENTAWLNALIGGHDQIVVAWGATGGNAVKKLMIPQIDLVRELLKKHHREASCLGRTDSGAPRHPLMQSYQVPLQPWT